MNFFYQTATFTGGSNPIDEKGIKLSQHIIKKSNWRISKLPNGFFQTECKDPVNQDIWVDVTRRKTVESAEEAIDSTIDYFTKKLQKPKAPEVVKTFE